MYLPYISPISPLSLQALRSLNGGALPSPAVTVYLPLTMDFESAQRLLSSPPP